MAARRTCTCTFSECSNEGDLMKVCRGLRCVCVKRRGGGKTETETIIGDRSLFCWSV